jgi:hypothetical protein
MKTVIIACRTLEDELRYAMKKTGVTYPVQWLESGLHEIPKKLNEKLQEVLDQIDAQRVLLVLGTCGNAVLGIRTGDFELIMPRVDDCISLLLGSVRNRTAISDEYAAYFLTDGWMRGERNLWVEYQYTADKYGESEAQNIMNLIYRHYRTLALLDSGTVPIGPLVESTKIIADTLKLEQKIIPATISYIELLLTGPWNGAAFIVKLPHETIVDEDLRY